jgi:hypothetical protein
MSQGTSPRKIRSNDFSRFRFRSRGHERLKSSLQTLIFICKILGLLYISNNGLTEKTGFPNVE